MKLRQLRYQLRVKLRLKAAPRLEVTVVTAIPSRDVRTHARTHTRAPALAQIFTRNYRKLSNDGALRRNFTRNFANSGVSFQF